MKQSRTFFKMSEVRATKSADGKLMVSGYAAIFDSLSVPLWGFRERLPREHLQKPSPIRRTISARSGTITAI